MRTKFYLTGVLISTLLFSIPALSQDTTGLPLKWDLQTCLEYARTHNIQLQTLRGDVQLSEQDLLLARAARIPSLSASLTQSIVNSKNANPVVGGFQTQANVSGNYSLNSSWTVYNGGYVRSNIKQSDLFLRSAGLSVEQAQNDITLQITQSYLNILLAKENIVYLQDVLTTSRAQKVQGKQRFDAGSISRKDYVQLEAQTANDEYTVVNAQNAVRQNIVTLKQVLQLPSSFQFDVVEPDTLIAKTTIPSLSEAESAALITRPEIKIGDLGVQIAQAELDKARSGFYPTVSIGAGLSTGYSDNQDNVKYFSQLDNNFYQRLGITLSIPIFSNRINRTNVERSKIQIEQAKLSLLGTKTTLDQAVEQSYIDVLNAQAQFTAAEAQLKASEESYHISTEQLRLGAVNTVELLQQKNLYVQALQAYIQAKYNSILSHKIYDFYTGVPVTL
jgi:outer membrane protein